MGCASGKHQPSEPAAAAPPNTLLGSTGQAAAKPAHSAFQATPAPPSTTQAGVPPEGKAPAEQTKSVSAELMVGGQYAMGGQACAEADDAAASAEQTAKKVDASCKDAAEQTGMPTEKVAPCTMKTTEEPMEPTGMSGGAEHAKPDAAKASDAALASKEAEGAELGLSETAALSPQPLEIASSEGKANQEVPSGTIEHEVARADQGEEQASKCTDPEKDMRHEPAAAIDDLPARALRPSMGLLGVCCRGPESTEPEITVRSSQLQAGSQ